MLVLMTTRITLAVHPVHAAAGNAPAACDVPGEGGQGTRPLQPSHVCPAGLQANLAKIAAHNSQPGVTFQLGLNAHADLSAEEFRLRYFGLK